LSSPLPSFHPKFSTQQTSSLHTANIQWPSQKDLQNWPTSNDYQRVEKFLIATAPRVQPKREVTVESRLYLIEAIRIAAMRNSNNPMPGHKGRLGNKVSKRIVVMRLRPRKLRRVKTKMKTKPSRR
jgi:hypothetical protein